MTIGLLKEKEGENRVSVLPEIAAALVNMQVKVWFEPGAGYRSFEKDEDYAHAGAVSKSRDEILSHADMLLSIHLLSLDEIAKVKSGAVLVGTFQPLYNFHELKTWAE